jgi:hypothetical protein
MSVIEMQRLVQYVTDSQGTQTGVVVPIGLWEKILGSWDSSDLFSIDEDDSKEKILADLTEAMRSTRAGEVFPIDQLWEKVYE